LYLALTLQALTDAAAPESPEVATSAKTWLESDDEGFAALASACEHFAAVSINAPNDIALPRTPTDWLDMVREAYRDHSPNAFMKVASTLEDVASPEALNEPLISKLRTDQERTLDTPFSDSPSR
jgi:hypothetical protein